MRLTERKYGEIVSSKREKEPIQCSTFCNNCSKGTGNCNYVKEMVEKLAKYEDAEEQGLLLRLPCKVGDAVYLVCKRYTKCTEHGIEHESYSCEWCECLECDSKIEYYIHKNRSVSLEWIARYLKDFGKTVFLTREEAESALAEKGGAE